jgi:hypothetical protein
MLFLLFQCIWNILIICQIHHVLSFNLYLKLFFNLKLKFYEMFINISIERKVKLSLEGSE